MKAEAKTQNFKVIMNSRKRKPNFNVIITEEKKDKIPLESPATPCAGPA